MRNFTAKTFAMSPEITVAQATALANQRLQMFEREQKRQLVLGAPRAHDFGWSFSYRCDGENLIGAPLIFVTKTRRVYEIGFPFDVELFIKNVLDGGEFNMGYQPPLYEVSDES